MTYDANNIFAKIIRGELPADKIYEDDKVIAINDRFPAAPVHILVIPKGEYKSFDDFVATAGAADVEYFFTKVREVAHTAGLKDSGYRLIANHGADASQTVPHFHMHILGKKLLGPLVAGDGFHSFG